MIASDFFVVLAYSKQNMMAGLFSGIISLTENTKKIENYQIVLAQAKALFANEKNLLSNLSNASALLRMTLPNSVFTGLYLFDSQELLLGPFQGGVLYAHTALGKDVCDEAAANQETIIVADVTKHANYTPCDSAAMGEIVVFMIKNNQLVGVLDPDSRLMDDYDAIDQGYFEKFVAVLLEKSYWNLGMLGVEK